MSLSVRIKTLPASTLLILLGIVWGSSFILIKRILPCYSPIQYASMRIFITGFSFAPWFLSSYKIINRKQLMWLCLLGFLGYFLAYLFMGISQTHISSGMAGVMSSLSPLFTFIIGILFFSQLFKWKNLWGVLLGLSGCLVLLFFNPAHKGSLYIEQYAWFMIFSVLASAVTINITHKHLKGLSPYNIASVSFGIVAIPALLFFIFITDWLAISQNNLWMTCSLSMLLLGFFGTVLASLVYFHLINHMGALYASTVTYIIPVVALLWGYIDGEMMSWNNIFGLILIIGGIQLIRAR